MKNTAKWIGAIALSLLAHAGAASLFEPKPEPAEIAGGEAMEVTLLGNAFDETIQAGDPTQPVDPIEQPPEEVEAIQPEETAPVVAEIAPFPSEVTPTETPDDIVPVEADVILPVEEMPPVAVAEAEVTATVAPAETVVPQEKPEIKPEPEKIEIDKPVIEKPLKEKKREARKKPVKEKTEKTVSRQKAGEAGRSAASQKKGQQDGAENATASTAKGKKGATSQQSGNAAVSNYPGKIRSKLNRAFRYPAEAKRQSLRGTALVSFTVSANGGVSGVGIARSAGSPVLDAAAIKTVQRAAPFPKIPDGAGRDSWFFTIPLAFER